MQIKWNLCCWGKHWEKKKMLNKWSYLHLIILGRKHEIAALRQSQWSGKTVLDFCLLSDRDQALLHVGAGQPPHPHQRALLKVLPKMKLTHARLLKVICFTSALLQALYHSNLTHLHMSRWLSKGNRCNRKMFLRSSRVIDELRIKGTVRSKTIIKSLIWRQMQAFKLLTITKENKSVY